MVHINYLKDSTIKIKARTLRLLKILKNNEFIYNKLYYYLKNLLPPRFYGQSKYASQGFLYILFHKVAPCCTILTNA